MIIEENGDIEESYWLRGRIFSTIEEWKWFVNNQQAGKVEINPFEITFVDEKAKVEYQLRFG